MGLQFRKSVTLCKGVRVNVGKTGASLSVGTRGARYTMHSSGRRTASIGVPGTGLYYTQSTYGGKRNYNSQAYVQRQRIYEEQKMIQKQNQLAYNQLIVKQYNNYIDVIRGVHKECKKMLDWESAYREPMPVENTNALTDISNKIKEIRNKIERFLFKESELSQNGDVLSKQEVWKQKHEFANRILTGDVDAYLEAISEANLFDDILDFGSEFEIGADSPDEIGVEFKVMSDKIVPEIDLTLTQTGKLSKKKLTKTMYFDYMQDYVCSCSIRVAREIFALLPVRSVVVHAVDDVLDTSTGHVKNVTILSVRYLKTGFENINFDGIDPSDFVETFEHKMKFYKTKGFVEVNRLGE